MTCQFVQFFCRCTSRFLCQFITSATPLFHLLRVQKQLRSTTLVFLAKVSKMKRSVICHSWTQQRSQSSRGCWSCNGMRYLPRPDRVTRAETCTGMHVARNIGASIRLSCQTFSTSLESLRLCALRTRNRERTVCSGSIDERQGDSPVSITSAFPSLRKQTLHHGGTSG